MYVAYVLFLVAHGSAAGEWVSCNQVLLGFELCQGSYQWDDKPNFNINHCSTGNVTVSLGITIKGVSRYYVYINACLPRCDMLLLTHALVHSFQFFTYVDYPSPSNDYTNRAHFSLPQPLHLRVTLKDQMGHSVSVRFEQVKNNVR